MHLVGGQPGGSTDRIVVCKFHVRQVGIPILLLICGHGEHLSHDMVYALDVAVAVRMGGLVATLCMPCSLYMARGSLENNSETVVGKATNGAPPCRDVFVHPDVRGAFGREIGRKTGVHAFAPAETVGEKDNITVFLRSDPEGAKLIDAYLNARPEQQEERKGGPARRLSR